MHQLNAISFSGPTYIMGYYLMITSFVNIRDSAIFPLIPCAEEMHLTLFCIQ